MLLRTIFLGAINEISIIGIAFSFKYLLFKYSKFLALVMNDHSASTNLIFSSILIILVLIIFNFIFSFLISLLNHIDQTVPDTENIIIKDEDDNVIGDFEDDVSELTYEWSSSIDGTLNMGSVIVESDVTLPIKNRQMKYN